MPKPRVFIGSSSEGIEYARNLADQLDQSGVCETDLWTRGFEPGSVTITALVSQAQTVDFAVLIATPDDSVSKRGTESYAPRDNVILELGLFMGALGPERAFLLLANNNKGKVGLPSDLAGLTYLVLHTREDGDIAAAADGVALKIEKQVKRLGSRPTMPAVRTQISDEAEELRNELARLRLNLEQQGWRVQKSDGTVFRVRNTKSRTFAMQQDRDPRTARQQLREFCRMLRSHGVRVSHIVRTPLETLT